MGLGSSAIGTLVERKRGSRCFCTCHAWKVAGSVKNGPALAGHGAEAVRDAIAETIMELPAHLRQSLTWDQGAEMAQHAQLRIDTDLDIYFCDPQSPWQRGSNENTNGLLRQYFPKGTDLSKHELMSFGPQRTLSIAGRAKRWVIARRRKRSTGGSNQI
ncbi:IS30 family transposase [Ochrobactrum intermedium]|nr:IS30 family transposase [Ochrobactrum sp. MC-1LL]